MDLITERNFEYVMINLNKHGQSFLNQNLKFFKCIETIKNEEDKTSIIKAYITFSEARIKVFINNCNSKEKVNSYELNYQLLILYCKKYNMLEELKPFLFPRYFIIQIIKFYDSDTKIGLYSILYYKHILKLL